MGSWKFKEESEEKEKLKQKCKAKMGLIGEVGLEGSLVMVCL